MAHCRSRSWLAAGVLGAWLVGGCGSSDSNGNPNGLSGTLDVATFTIPAGETREATADLTVRTTGDLVVDGTLLLDPGVSVALLAEGDLTIRGQVRPAPGAARAGTGTRQAAKNNDLILSGRSIDLINSAGVQADGNGSVYLVGVDLIKISGSMTAGNGDDATQRLERGRSGGSVQIGTAAAIAKATDKGAKAPSAPSLVQVSGTLQAGHGGKGGDDTVGTTIGASLLVTGAGGGAGGALEIVATVKLDLTGGTLRGGNGGAGGDAGGGAAGPVLHGPDGTRAGERGSAVFAAGGVGGRGSDVVLTSPRTVNEAAAGGGRGGDAGSCAVAAGNGGPGGDGGDTSIGRMHPGDPGLPVIAFPTAPKQAVVRLVGGGNGGDAVDLQHKGGKGGTVDVFDAAANFFAEFVVRDYGNGGDGFFACTGGASPATGGGDVGTLAGRPPRTALALGNRAARPTLTRSFNGGCGGDGLPPGKEGLTGKDDQGVVLGVDGLSGEVCGVDNVLMKVDAVQLKQDYTGNDGTVWKAGMIIKLSRITGGHTGRGSECTIPVDSQARHLHSDNPALGVTIDSKSIIKESEADTLSCGFGLIVQVCVP